MHRTRIKICGVCRAEDAAAAAHAGADAIGMVFHRESHRFVEIDEAKRIVAAVPAFVSRVGVFVDPEKDEIYQALALLLLSTVQLHGDETPDMIRRLRPLRIIKALRTDRSELELWKRSIANGEVDNLVGIILETADTGVPGGSGVANDWEAIAALQSEGTFEGLPPLILAGGLTPENVGDIVRRFKPFAVDVSSGVESGRRQKDREKIEAFIKAVHKADHDIAKHHHH
ncbi:MAG: phosphoribosylanthranilate isomerase [Tepidisphaeraceae bacterium]